MGTYSFLSTFLLLTACTTEAIKVKIYEKYDLEGYYNFVDFRASESDSSICTNVNIKEMSTPIRNGSIETDTCLMIYAFPDCTGLSAKIYPGSYNINRQLFNIFLDRFTAQEKKYGATGLSSIYPCDAKIGGDVLNVDILWNSDKDKVEFKDVCSCRNLPKSLLDLLKNPRAENYGNDFIKYTEPNCKGEPRLVPAGHNEDSEFFYDFGEDRILGIYVRRRRIVESIGPIVVSQYYQKHCVKLTAKITKFVFLETDEQTNSSVIKPEDAELTQKSVFRNDGNAKITQEYKVSHKIKEKLELELAKTLTHIFKIGGEFSLEIAGGLKVPILTESTTKIGLKAAIEDEEGTELKESSKKTVANIREYSIKQQIEVPACTEYSVWGVVKMVKDRPLAYKVYSEITGEFGLNGKRMTAKEIRKNIGKDVRVLEDLDEWRVSTVAKGVMKASYGMEAIVDGHGTKIDGCKV